MVKKENAVTFSAGIVVGTVVCLLGVMSTLYLIQQRKVERLTFGNSDLHPFGWLIVVCIFAAGVFYAHAGMIYWWRRILRKK
jgi:hypothetical protein